MQAASPSSLVVVNSFDLELDETTMLELDRCHQKNESKWHHSWSVCICMKGYG